MNILFLTMYAFRSLSDSGIYEDMLREFVQNGHSVYAVSPIEKREGEKTHVAESFAGFALLRVKTGDLQKTGFLKKGIATLRVPTQFTKAIKKNFRNVKFDLLLYSTPPITLYDTVRYFKRRDAAQTFLLLKDIFPQNAIDIGVLRKSGWRGVLYKYFRKKERELYRISDHIGCMSRANVAYVLANNPDVVPEKMAVVPNSITPINVTLSDGEKAAMRDKYGIPQDKTVFVYGGNLGKPQDIPFVIRCLQSQQGNTQAFFVIAGDGTEYCRLQEYVNTADPQNVLLLQRLPRADFDTMLAACDVGMLFLDHRFTIPNYPSRLLSYMQAGLPVLACTDTNTDVGTDIENGGFGWWCESGDVSAFAACVQKICNEVRADKGQRAKAYLYERFTAADGYKKITEKIGENK